jgi:hypothetical protein
MCPEHRSPGQTRRFVAIGGGVLGSAIAASLVWAQSALMTLPGSFEVTEAGASGYTIPIAVPPGTAGVEPKLSLVYRSQGVNGLLGVGWSLSGLSEISRCPRTIAQDGTRGSVNYNTDDRFCLDGQRLIVVSGTYGAAASAYRTELETFAEIKASTAMAGTGPASFTVRTKSGLIMEYGSTADSRVEAVGKPEARSWALAKVSDRHGNAMTITYTEEGGAARPARIDYTTNPGASVTVAATSVRFTYEARTDVATAGDKRLARVTTYHHGPPEVAVSDYRVTYAYGPVTSRSRITQVTRCDGLGGTAKCVPATTFSYSDTAQWPAPLTDFGLRIAASAFNGASQAQWVDDVTYPRLMADANGDGRADIVRFAADGVWVALSNGDSFDTPTRWHTGFGTSDGYPTQTATPRLLADVNADGLPDIVGFKSGGAYVALGTGAGFAAAQLWLASVPTWDSAAGNRPRLIDVNGDGRADLVVFNAQTWVATSTGTAFNPAQVWHSRGVIYSNSGTIVDPGSGPVCGECNYWPPTFTPYSYSWTEANAPTMFADINGDGIPDIFWFGSYIPYGHPSVRIGSETSFGTEIWPGNQCDPLVCGPPSYSYSTSPILVGDINGDGRSDFVIVFSNTAAVHYTDWPGSGQAGGVPSPGLQGNSGAGLQHLIDINGDGLADIVEFVHGGAVYAFSTGTGFPVARNWHLQYGGVHGWFSQSIHPRYLVDVDGDGRPDIVGFKEAGVFTTRSAPSTAPLPFPDLIVSISNGLGVSRTVEYRTLAQPTPADQAALYTKGSGSLYPHIDLQVPLPVVRETRVPARFAATNGQPDAWHTTRYAYGELRGEATGRGMKGFRWVEALQVETNLRVRTEYSQDYPFTGSPTLIERAVLNAQGQVTQVISRVTTNFRCYNFADPITATCGTLAGRRYFPFQYQSIEEAWDLNGAVMPKVTTTTEFGEPTTAFFGNATKVTVRTETTSPAQAWIRETVSQYTNNTTEWLLGRLTNTTVTSTTP